MTDKEKVLTKFNRQMGRLLSLPEARRKWLLDTMSTLFVTMPKLRVSSAEREPGADGGESGHDGVEVEQSALPGRRRRKRASPVSVEQHQENLIAELDWFLKGLMSHDLADREWLLDSLTNFFTSKRSRRGRGGIRPRGDVRAQILRAVADSPLSARSISAAATGADDTIRNIQRGAFPRVNTAERICAVLGFRLELVPEAEDRDDRDVGVGQADLDGQPCSDAAEFGDAGGAGAVAVAGS